jgi:ATP-dependent helicase/nuclease subunit A
MSVAAPARDWTAEQLEAIERRDGDLLLAAAAGSGKTSVLVERFVRMVLEDGIDVAAILTITFTEKAAAEMRDRIRERLRALGADEAARATEGAFISTIHGFCARLLRAHAVPAGLDPAFAVLDQPEAQRLADAAFDEALEHSGGAVDLVAAYGAGPLRAAILAIHDELRSRGQTRPALPPMPPAPDLEAARSALREAATAVQRELGAIDTPSAKVVQALERLERLERLSLEGEPWPGLLDRFCLPGGNGAALSTDACAAYTEAMAAFRRAVEHRYAVRTHAVLDRLLRGFAERYAERKRGAAGLDFEDLELMTRDLLAGDEDVRQRYRARFAQIMVDEFQDTNQVQLELIEAVANDNLFTVGDAQQSIYGFRHADVELFARRAQKLAEIGARLGLTMNFRSRPEVLAVINAAFEDFTPVTPGREDPPACDPRVELIVADKAAAWAVEGQASPWRLAEARALAQRVAELVQAGTAPEDIVVLTRATTDLRTYERALEDRGVPTYMIGGRGYWSHPQVIDLLAYLRALANPLDEEALVMLLASPLVGASADELVILAGAARDEGRPLWQVVQQQRPDFAAWFATERAAAARLGVDELIDRALARTGYDLAVLAMPGGRRRLANVRKLMRLGREHAEASGADLRGFLELVRRRASAWSMHESEAPVEGETVDAVRLMTIHRAKGLEFDVVCVADLGRGPRWPAELLRLGRDGRRGIRLAQAGTTRAVPALDYIALGDAQAETEAREERRLFYVAMTRARERLILSGAARLDAWPDSGSPIAWIGPALVPEIGDRVEEGSGITDAGVRFEFVSAAGEQPAPDRLQRLTGAASEPPAATSRPATPPTVPALSYSSLEEYQRCGYRFYAERVLGLPGHRPQLGSGPSATERGVRVHALLERLDFRRPVVPEAADADVRELIERFARSELCRRLGLATQVRREQRFRFLLEDRVLVHGAIDVLAREPGQMLVIDYKTGTRSRSYETQQLLYALAVLRSGAAQVEVIHVFLERPEESTGAVFTRAQLPELERRVAEQARAVLRGDYTVTDTPHRAVCDGCPAEGGLCSWPLAMTRRDAPDQLF